MVQYKTIINRVKGRHSFKINWVNTKACDWWISLTILVLALAELYRKGPTLDL